MKFAVLAACAAVMLATPCLAQEATTTTTTTAVHTDETTASDGTTLAPQPMDPSPAPEHDAPYAKGSPHSHNPDLAPGSDVRLGGGSTGSNTAKGENDTATTPQ